MSTVERAERFPTRTENPGGQPNADRDEIDEKPGPENVAEPMTPLGNPHPPDKSARRYPQGHPEPEPPAPSGDDKEGRYTEQKSHRGVAGGKALEASVTAGSSDRVKLVFTTKKNGIPRTRASEIVLEGRVDRKPWSDDQAETEVKGPPIGTTGLLDEAIGSPDEPPDPEEHGGHGAVIVDQLAEVGGFSKPLTGFWIIKAAAVIRVEIGYPNHDGGENSEDEGNNDGLSEGGWWDRSHEA